MFYVPRNMEPADLKQKTPLERLAYYLGFPNPKLALLLPLFFLIGGVLVATTLPFLDSKVWGGAPVVQIFAELLWFFLMYLGFYRWRDFYRKKYGERAYQQITLRYFIPGASLLFAGMLRSIWVSGPEMESVPKIVRMGLGLYLLITGLLLERKGIQSLEIDRVMLVYTIFPERGSAVQSHLYEYLRHPLYSAYMRFSFGIALLSGTIPGLLCAFVFGLKLFILSKLEEKELIGRFGESYKEYMKKVPAFVPKFRQLKNFWRVLLILFLSVFISPFSFASATQLDGLMGERYPHLEKFYQERHQHPELSKQESDTSQKLAEELRGLGFQVVEKVGGFGVVAVLKNGGGPVGLIRTDMDALPIQETTNLSYKSLVPGVMHACGHDVHMSVFLGTAYLLTQIKDQWRGTLVMIGQPAEEIGAGSKAMIEAGLFRKFPKPDYALALHVMDFLPAGIVGFTKGYALANVDSVDITVFGKGGHGARPHTTIDPIVLSSQIVLALQTLVSREMDPIQNAVVTVGSIHGGAKHNIIPNEVHLQLTVRSYEESVRQHLKEGIKRIAENLSAMVKAPKPKVEFSEGTPALYNDPKLVDEMATVFEEVFGKERVKELPKGMWGEDFSRYGLEGNIPIVMFGLGAQPPDKKRWGTAHSPTFAPDFEPAFKTGVVAMTKVFLKLQSKFPLP